MSVLTPNIDKDPETGLHAAGIPGGRKGTPHGLRELRAFSASKCLNFLKGLGRKIGKVNPLDLENTLRKAIFPFLPAIR